MTTVSFQPITITFTQTCEVSVEEYLEWCEMYENIPSQKGYKKFVIDYFEEDLRDDINPDNFTFKYDKEKEYEYEYKEIEDGEVQIPFNYEKYVSDLSEEEIEEFHKLLEMDKMITHPFYTKNDIITMNSNDNLSLYYGVKINKKIGEIVHIMKSEIAHHLYEYLRTLEKPSQENPQVPLDAL